MEDDVDRGEVEFLHFMSRECSLASFLKEGVQENRCRKLLPINQIQSFFLKAI